ncbi:MAG: hypothetical protein DMF89_17155 [Acidobacteria bacterium]|nr:MAG: hypothetical protein DMF89_17155 [Acidobacteriota bacterium]
MRRSLMVLLGACAVLTALGSSGAAAPKITPGQATKASSGLKDRFVGAWKLVNIETRNAKGEVVPPNPPGRPTPVGYIIYDSAGYVAVGIMPSGRKKYAAAQPTPDEALAAMTGYAAYYGTFTINEGEGFVTHHLEGSLNPGMGADQKRFFELSGNRLTLKPPPGATGNQARITWERIPDVPNLTAEHRKFIGFWKLVSNERRNEKGDLVSANTGQTGYIIYTAAGVMMVEMMQPNRQKFAGPQPTAEEARQNMRVYTNYFGPFYIHEADHYVVHDQIATLNPGRNGPSPQQRFYTFSGNRLILKPPLTPNALDGQIYQGTITWERVGGNRGSQ